MRVAVFGRTGQVASELARRVPGDAAIEIIDRATCDFSIPDNVFDCARALNVDAVINAAAYTSVDRAEDEANLANAVNGVSVGALAQACDERGVPLIHISTDYVLDGSGDVPRQPDAPTHPLGAYGRSKLLGETLVRDTGVRHAILRTSWVFSAHGANFVKTMLRLGGERDRLTIVDDQVGGPTPAAAIADALFTVVRAMIDGHSGGTYHFSGAPNTSWAGFAREIFTQASLNVSVTGIPTTDYPTPALRPLNSRLDCESLFNDFSISRPDWRAGLSDVLRELRAK